MSTSDTENRSRDIFQVLSEYPFWPDDTLRKRLAKALAEEGVSVADLRRRCQRLSRVDEWVRILVRTKNNGHTNTMNADAAASTSDVDTHFIVESVNTEGKTPEDVAEHMGWPLSKVEEVLERYKT